MTSLSVAIFSFNRGAHLANCVDSFRRHAPWVQITVYDDGSDDPETLLVLKNLDLTVSTVAKNSDNRHGGLYGNMNCALKDADAEWILFVQDDMQLIRNIGQTELTVIADLFAEDERRAFVSPLFMKQRSMQRYCRRLAPHPHLRAYTKHRDADEAIVYFDVSIGHVSRLRRAKWVFGATELLTMARAAKNFTEMPFLGDPFLFYCPEVPIFRNKGRSLVSKLANKVVGDKVKEFQDMQPDTSFAFLNRNLTTWPVAEDWLILKNLNVRRPFVYNNINARWWLQVLYRLERMLRL